MRLQICHCWRRHRQQPGNVVRYIVTTANCHCFFFLASFTVHTCYAAVYNNSSDKNSNECAAQQQWFKSHGKWQKTADIFICHFIFIFHFFFLIFALLLLVFARMLTATATAIVRYAHAHCWQLEFRYVVCNCNGATIAATDNCATCAQNILNRNDKRRTTNDEPASRQATTADGGWRAATEMHFACKCNSDFQIFLPISRNFQSRRVCCRCCCAFFIKWARLFWLFCDYFPIFCIIFELFEDNIITGFIL